MTDRARPHRIGIVAARLAGTDGVSLESAKWEHQLAELGHTCFYFAGECDREADRCRIIPEARLHHETVRRINDGLFSHGGRRAPEISEAIHDLRRTIKRELSEFVQGFDLDLLIVENALSLPMNVPLGLAITELICELAIPTIAHHHDFFWQRERYLLHAADDYVHAAFPPPMPSITHVVINSHAARDLARRTGLQSTQVPNVMDFENAPPEPDGYGDDLREAVGIDDRRHLLLQPTRVVPRKRIERSIELARWLDLPCTLVVTHEAGDEGTEYLEYLADYAEVMGVEVIFAAERFDQRRGRGERGAKVYSLADAYRAADLVTYPSRIEGFGNAFLEALYYRRPLVMSSYEIFSADIRPKGFRVIEFAEFVNRSTIAAARRAVRRPGELAEDLEQNYQRGRDHYSYTVLRDHLATLLEQLPAHRG